MSNLYLDTETQGLIADHLALDHPSQPWPVEVAAILEDDQGGIAAELSLIIKPDGWSIPDSAAKIHGITTDYANQVGVPLPLALEMLAALALRAATIVTHNALFDLNIIDSACQRLGLTGAAQSIVGLHHYCTMRAWSDKFGGKWPKLKDAYKTATGKDLAGGHGALNDCKACRAITHHISKV